MRKGRRWFKAIFALFALVLVNCSRAVRLNVVLELPDSARDESRLHVSGTKSCPPGPLHMLNPSRGKTDAERHQVAADAHGFKVESTFHGGQCSLALSAWYDSNGNGTVDAGDYVGETRPVLAVDRGLCQGNLVQAADLTLAPVP